MKALFALASAGAVLAGCGPSTPWPSQSAAPAPTDDGDGGYRAPPQALAAIRDADGGVALSGKAQPGAVVRLSSPNGNHLETQADAAGAWSLRPPPGAAALYGLSQATAERRDQGEGYLAVLPNGPLAVAELRSGAGAVALAGGPGKPVLLAADLDRSGVTVVSGWAQPNQALRVMVDGAPAADGAAGPDGRFAVSLPKPLAAGVRAVQVLSPLGAAQASVDVSAAPPLAGVLRAAPRGGGWRLDWATPAGGVQTTELFAPEAGR